MGTPSRRTPLLDAQGQPFPPASPFDAYDAARMGLSIDLQRRHWLDDVPVQDPLQFPCPIPRAGTGIQQKFPRFGG